MRKALATPAILFEWFVPLSGDDNDALAKVLMGRWLEADASKPDQQGLWWGQGPEQGQGVLSVSQWALGSQALDARAKVACAPLWRQWAPRLAAQPQVYLLPLQELPWAWGAQAQEQEMTLLLATVDVLNVVPLAGEQARSIGRRARGRLLGRDELPTFDGVERLWPVLGHAGRLMLQTQGQDTESLEAALTQGWGPLAEPLARWRLSSSPN